MYRRFCCLIALACVSAPIALFADEDEKNAQQEAAPFVSRILALTDVVLEKHIDPPTRQEMILAGVKSLYRAHEQPVPQGLSGQISNLATEAQWKAYLQQVLTEFDELNDAEGTMTSGMLASVPGRSFLIDAQENSVQQSVRNNRYVGTGIALTMNADEHIAQISRVFANGPAWNAGVKKNDLIIEIDGESTESRSLRHVVEKLRGADGSQVVAVVRQPDATESRKLTITRGRVFIPTVEGIREKPDGQWQYTLDKAPDIALLRITSIGPSTPHELRQVAEQLKRQKVRGVVLDLRTGGAILHYVVMVSSGLLDGGTIGHVRSLDSSLTHEARPGDFFQGLPMAVLVAKQTSPGYVFLTAALQDNERAIVVGEPTVGETYVSAMLPLPDRNQELRLAVGVMQRGDGTPLLPPRLPPLPEITGQGAESQRKRPGFIVPDHIVNFAPPDPGEHAGGQRGRDAQLEKAIQVLQKTGAHAAAVAAETDVSG